MQIHGHVFSTQCWFPYSFVRVVHSYSALLSLCFVMFSMFNYTPAATFQSFASVIVA